MTAMIRLRTLLLGSLPVSFRNRGVCRPEAKTTGERCRTTMAILLAMLLVGVAGCGPGSVDRTASPALAEGLPRVDGHVCVAVIAGASLDEGSDMLREVLTPEGIEFGISGSVFYDVMVAEKHAARAIQVMRGHPELRERGIYLYDEWIELGRRLRESRGRITE